MSERDVLQLAEYSGLTDQQALDRLLEVTVLSTDSTAYTWSGTNERLGQLGLPLEVLAGWDSVLIGLPGGSMMDRMLSSGGVNYTLPDIRAGLQAVLDANPGESVAAVITALMEIGVRHGPRWQSYGGVISAEPTLDSIAAARATIASEALRDWWDVTANAVRTEMSAGRVLTRQQCLDVAATLLGAP